MTKEKDQDNRWRKAVNSEHFINAAKCLSKRMKSPAQFLDFLSWAVFYVNNYEREQKVNERNSCVSDFVEMIQAIVIPWMKSPNRSIKVLTNGIFEIYEWGGAKQLIWDCMVLERSFADSLVNGTPQPQYFLEYMNGIHCITEIAHHLSLYEHNTDTVKEAA